MKKFRTRPGVSLVIAMLMVMAFMILIADIGQSMLRTQRIAQGMQASDQATLNAQFGLELGLYAQNKPEKFDAILASLYKNDIKKADDSGILFNDGSSIHFKISNAANENGQVCVESDYNDNTSNSIKNCSNTGKTYFTYPLPGSGSTGGKECDLKTQPILKNKKWLEDMYLFMKGKPYSDNQPIENAFVNQVNDMDTLEHPCLWNTLPVGTAAEIPLFIQNAKGEIIGADKFSEFYVRARFPCKKGIACEEKERAVPISNKTRALAWDITAECKDNPVCYLSDTTENDVKNKNFLIDSIISFSKLGSGIANNNIKNIVLAFTSSQKKLAGKDNAIQPKIGAIKDFLGSKDKWNGMEIKKPFFHLSIANPLNTSDKQTVDAIEYQILYTLNDNKIPPIITNPTVTAQGSSGGYTTTLQSSVSKQTGTYGYGLIGK